MPSARVVLRLITKVNLLAYTIGRSPGLVPLDLRHIGAAPLRVVDQIAGIAHQKASEGR
jgi:hypothetical protein